MNDTTIVGRVVKEPIMKKTAVGACCFVTVAVNGAKDTVDYFNVKLFDRQAENCRKYVRKGDLVSVRGSVHLNQWGENKQYASLGMDQAWMEFYGKRSNPSGRAEEEERTVEDEATNMPPKDEENDWAEIEDDEDMPFF